MTILASPFSPLTQKTCVLGEGICWHPRLDRLFWIDIKGSGLFSVRTDGTDAQEYDLEGGVSAIAPALMHDFICARRKGFSFLNLAENGPQLTPIADIEADLPHNRCNDGKLDPHGGFWVGTMDDRETRRSGSWWRLTPDQNVTKLCEGIKVTNGPAFAPNGSVGYFNDSADQLIYNFKPEPHGFTAKSIFKEHGPGQGYPDGITVDRAGNLWVAFWGAACIRIFSPLGALIEELAIPAQQPTSVELIDDRIFVTSACIDLDAPGEHDGKTFVAKLLEPRGQPERLFFDDTSFE